MYGIVGIPNQDRCRGFNPVHPENPAILSKSNRLKPGLIFIAKG